jgi:hypothetical protein
VPGDGGDDPAITWNLWWVKHAILNEGHNPFQSDYIFYPVGINLAFYTLTVLNAVTTLPLTLNFGVVVAGNLHLAFTFIAGGYGTFLLTRYLLVTTFTAPTPASQSSAKARPAATGNLAWACAAIAGGFYVFASSKLFYVALGQFNIASSHWVPFAVLYVIRTHRRPTQLKNAFMAGLFLTLQAWSEITYASFLLVFIAFYWLYWLVSGIARRFLLSRQAVEGKQAALTRPLRVWPAGAAWLRSALVLGLTFAVGIAPILLQMLPEMQREGDFLVEGGGFADVFSADVLGFLIPTLHHPLLGQLVGQTNISAFDKGQHIYLGYVLLGLALVTLVTGFRQASVRFWLIAVAGFALLALGPVITINGQPSQVDGPFTIFQSLPLFKGNRYPSRYSVMLLLSLSVVAAFGLASIGSRVGRDSGTLKGGGLRPFWPLMLMAGLFLFEHLAIPLPLSDMRPPPAYQIVGDDPADSTLLDIPFAWRNGFRISGALTTQFMFGQFYQTAHQKRLLQGNTSRNPEFKFQYFMNAPVINSLLALETGKSISPEQMEYDRSIAPAVLRFFNIEYVVVRPDDSHSATITPQETIPYIEDVLPLDKIHDDPTIKIYRIRSDSADHGGQAQFQIDSKSPLAPLYFGEGWGVLSPGRPAMVQRKEARLIMPLTGGRQRISFRLRLPAEAQVPARSMWLALNGWESAPQRITADWREYSFETPAGLAHDGLNNLFLRFDDVTSIPPPDANIPPIDVTVLSAGEEVGGFGHIFVNGRDVSPNRRGYNVAIIRHSSGSGEGAFSLQQDSFDTHLDPDASAALVAYLSQQNSDLNREAGTIIAVAAADEASAGLSEAAVLSLQEIAGATSDLRGCFRCSHAIISETGTPDGRVIEALDPLRPVGVTTGLGLTEPALAAAVDWIRVEAIED